MKDTRNINLKNAGLFLGLILFIFFLSAPAPGGLEASAWKTAAVAVLMVTWWITEAVPIAATALVPVVLFPVLGIATIGESTAPYANQLIFLFLGGFVIATAMQAWNLHRRIALRIIRFAGVKPSSIIAGFIAASAFLSMWVSNTATAMMMLPIALSVMTFTGRKDNMPGASGNFEIILVLSIAYSCSTGGMATLIGTPPNALFAAFMLERYGIEISFARWMLMGVPLVFLLLPLMYFILTRLAFPLKLKELPGGKAFIDKQISETGPMTKPERRVAIVFSVTACLWIFRPLLVKLIPGISDAGIAVAAGLVLFTLPSGMKPGQRLLSWQHLKELPWGILILFGGGLSLAMAINSSGLASFIGGTVEELRNVQVVFLILLVVLIIVFLTEITSNTAVASTFIPVLASMAIGLGQNPVLLALPAALAASCAFMMPVATPPNAIIYGSGKVSILQMAKAGLWLNIVFSIVITLAHYYLFTRFFAVEIDVIPGWAY